MHATGHEQAEDITGGGEGGAPDDAGPGGTRADRARQQDDELDALAVRAATGDRQAVDALLRALHRPVIRSCRARMGTRTVGGLTVEDVAQEVLTAVLSALPRFRPERTRLLAFVHGICKNKVADAFRAAGRDRIDLYEQVPDAVDERAGPEFAAVLAAQVARLREVLDQLPEHQREVLVLRIAMSCSAAETAALTGSTPGAVRVSQHRALNKIRALLGDLLTEDGW